MWQQYGKLAGKKKKKKSLKKYLTVSDYKLIFYQNQEKVAYILHQDCILSGNWFWEIQTLQAEKESFSVSPSVANEGKNIHDSYDGG